MSVYESPVKRRMREAVEDAHGETDFAEKLIEAIDNNPDVRAAILRLMRRQAATATRQAPQRGRSSR